MEPPDRNSAILAYLLPLFGSLYIFVFRRQDKFALFHAKQAFALVLTLLVMPLVWIGVTWLLSWLPFGFALGMTFFSFVILTLVWVVVVWFLGILYVSQSKARSLPIIGNWARRIPIN